jgi:hypothetical protein
MSFAELDFAKPSSCERLVTPGPRISGYLPLKSTHRDKSYQGEKIAIPV